MWGYNSCGTGYGLVVVYYVWKGFWWGFWFGCGFRTGFGVAGGKLLHGRGLGGVVVVWLWIWCYFWTDINRLLKRWKQQPHPGLLLVLVVTNTKTESVLIYLTYSMFGWKIPIVVLSIFHIIYIL